MLTHLRELGKRSKFPIIAFKIYQNWRMRRQFARGTIESIHGSTHNKKPICQSLRYINEQFEDYLKYSELSRDRLRGLRVLELGFGDNLGVALKFLVAGAEQVVCLDKVLFAARH
jgi:hypothetical protein